MPIKRAIDTIRVINIGMYYPTREPRIMQMWRNYSL